MNIEMMPDPFAQALHDYHTSSQTELLYTCDGQQRIEHPVEEFYFTRFPAPEDSYAPWLESQLAGPLLDIGAGVGKHARYFQERFQTTAIEVHPLLVECMKDQGIINAQRGDMFELPEQFEVNQFQSVLLYGTQIGLVKSRAGLKEVLDGIAQITTADGTVVFDSYDPAVDATAHLLGYRADPTPGLGFRVFSFEYDGVRGRLLLFRLFSPDRIREVCQKTVWRVDDSWQPEEKAAGHYLVALEKE